MEVLTFTRVSDKVLVASAEMGTGMYTQVSYRPWNSYGMKESNHCREKPSARLGKDRRLWRRAADVPGQYRGSKTIGEIASSML